MIRAVIIRRRIEIIRRIRMRRRKNNRKKNKNKNDSGTV
jgi:hypothetical protein